LIHPGIQFKAIEGNALFPDANFNEIRPYLGVKAVSVHAQIGGRVPEADQSWGNRAGLFHERLYCIEC
jgi:hypothetical protein